MTPPKLVTGDPIARGRLPDFLIIGAMKAATTSLFRWLDEHPETSLPNVKEIGFFHREARWARGLDWYGAHFSADAGFTTGEASVQYTNPNVAATVARRVALTLPGRRLVYIARDPEARARSHYLHEVRRAREHRSFGAAMADPASIYAAQSCAYRCLRPYLADPDLAARLLVVQFDDLVGSDPTAWNTVLDHLGLSRHPRPELHANEGAAAGQFRRPLAYAQRRGWVHAGKRLPGPARRLIRRALVRSTDDDLARTARVDAIPEEVSATWATDARRLADALAQRSQLPVEARPDGDYHAAAGSEG